MKIRIEKEVSIASAFTHLIAAWDYNRLPWYLKVEYTDAGGRAIDNDAEPLGAREALAYVTMEDPDDESATVDVEITGNWIATALRRCLNSPFPEESRHAMAIINDSSACDQNTADLVVQMGAYGRIVFG